MHAKKKKISKTAPKHTKNPKKYTCRCGGLEQLQRLLLGEPYAMTVDMLSKSGHTGAR